MRALTIYSEPWRLASPFAVRLRSERRTRCSGSLHPVFPASYQSICSRCHVNNFWTSVRYLVLAVGPSHRLRECRLLIIILEEAPSFIDHRHLEEILLPEMCCCISLNACIEALGDGSPDASVSCFRSCPMSKTHLSTSDTANLGATQFTRTSW